MKTGLLWYDDLDDGLAERVRRAAQHYEARMGMEATECHVNPSMVGREDETEVDGVRIVENTTILVNHFWIGRWNDDEPE